MPNIYFHSCDKSKHDVMYDFERYLDDNTSTIPHQVYEELVAIFDNLNSEVSKLQEKIDELED